MTTNSRIISPLLLFFFVFLVATDLVHGSSYDYCMKACLQFPTGLGREPCENLCSLLNIGIENKFEKNPKLLTGLFNHGVAILEASPNSLIAQGRLDADALFFVAQGKATADLILQEEDKREAMDLKAGDIIRIPLGTQVFMINKDTLENLVVIKLPQPVSTSGVKLLDPFTKSNSHQLAEGISSVI